MLKIKIKMAQFRILCQKLRKEAKKLALAVVIMEYLLAGGWYLAENKGIIDYFRPKTVIIEIARAKEAEPEPINDEINEIDKLSDYIWLKESTRGKNNYSKCEAIGEINGIGYNIPGNGVYQCFKSHAEEMQVLNGWILRHKTEGMTNNELMLHYSGNNYGYNN